MNEQVQEIFVEDIIPNRFQPRLTFDEKALQELSDSIKVHGVIQPLVLRKVGNKYEIIAGERRYKASCMAGLKKVPAIVRELTDNESAEIALIENIQRKNLSSIEEAQSYKILLDRGYLTQEELASKLGISQPTIANKLRLLNLCDEVQNALLNEQISERHARSLLQIQNPDEQKKMLDRIVKERLTVKQLDNEIKKMAQQESSGEESATDGGKTMEPVIENNEGTGDKGIMGAPNKNIFGFDVTPPTDLEKEETNLLTGNEEEIPPISFNPFSDVNFNTNINPDVTAPTETQPAEEVLETFDMFGDIAPTPSTVETEIQEAQEVGPTSSIGDQINSVRNVVKKAEEAGFRVEMEEYDFEDMYQMVVKIKK